MLCCLLQCDSSGGDPAIFQQTGRELNKKDIEMPEITEVGTYPVSIRLHPEVVGTFNVVVQREKNA